MKYFSSLILFFSLFLNVNTAQATIWRLNNSNGGALNPAIQASFPTATTLQQAHDNSNVQPGDTLHIEQSTATYGPLIMTKKLVLIGPGFFLDKNPKTQVNGSYGAPVGAITMDAASCAGSVLTGLTINGNVNMGTSRLILMRNYIAGSTVFVGAIGTTATDSLIIAQNYMEPSTRIGIQERTGGTGIITNLNITNNYIGAHSNNSSYTSISTGGRVSGGLLKNNVLFSRMQVSNMYVLNNMMFGTYSNTFYNCLLEFNAVKVATQFQAPSGTNITTNSVNNLAQSNLGFINESGTADNSMQLQTTSPAKGAGKSGEDMGIFGGAMPYVLSGIPAVPNVYELTIAPVAAGATSISVTVSAKSN